jgi:hypothetical protein
MSISIVHIVTGEQIICKLDEVKDNDGESVCFQFTMPMTCNLVPGDTDSTPSLNYFAWSPFSSTRQFRIGFDKIVAVCDPTWTCFKTYVNLVQPLHKILSDEELEQFNLEQKEREQTND